MPRLAPKICSKSGCGELTTKGGYCSEHKKEQSTGWYTYNKGKGNRHDRGYGSKWDLLRIKILRRDKHLCVPCKDLGLMTPATEVDHTVSKALGGNDNPSNLQSICNDCHKTKTRLESRGKYTKG